MNRPESFDFAMTFLGGKDAAELLAYVEYLEDAVKILTTQYCSPQFLEKKVDLVE